MPLVHLLIDTHLYKTSPKQSSVTKHLQEKSGEDDDKIVSQSHENKLN